MGMKLSEAMRKGTAARPGCKGGMFVSLSTDGKKQIHSCALGAAYEGSIGHQKTEKQLSEMSVTVLYDDLKLMFPQLGRVHGYDQNERHMTLEGAIVCLNDDKGWSRDRIADWVEEVEKRPKGAMFKCPT